MRGPKKRAPRLHRDRLHRVRLLAVPVKRSDLSNVKHRVRTSSKEVGEVRIAIAILHSSLLTWVDAVEKGTLFRGHERVLKPFLFGNVVA